MKVLFISHSSVFPPYREKLRLLAQKKNIDITLLVPHSWPEAGRRVKAQSQPASIEGFPILSLPILFAGRLKRHFYPFFWKHVRLLKPDLIHIHEEPYSLVAWQATRAAARLGVPLVFYTWENLLEHFPFPHQQIRSYVLGKAAHAIAGDQKVAHLLEKASFPRNKISIIPLDVNPKVFKKMNTSRLKRKLNLGPFTAGYIGRLVPEKGIQDLLQAFSEMKNKRNNLLIIGNGPLEHQLKEKAAELGIERQIRWIPAMNQVQLAEHLNAMDVLVLPSRTTPTWEEQFGRVIIEAQACEVPVLGSDSGAIPEVIGKAGLIFPEGDIQALKTGLIRLSHSVSLRKKMGKQGRARVLKYFTNQKIADQIQLIYHRLTHLTV